MPGALGSLGFNKSQVSREESYVMGDHGEARGCSPRTTKANKMFSYTNRASVLVQS